MTVRMCLSFSCGKTRLPAEWFGALAFEAKRDTDDCQEFLEDVSLKLERYGSHVKVYHSQSWVQMCHSTDLVLIFSRAVRSHLRHSQDGGQWTCICLPAGERKPHSTKALAVDFNLEEDTGFGR